MTAIARNHTHITRFWMLALLLIFVITAFRVDSIHRTYMREDEEIAFRSTENHDLGYTIWFQAEQDVHAPLWFMSFWAWQQIVGSTEFTARLYSLLLSMVTLALVYRLAMRWFGEPHYGVFAIVALGVNTYAHIYALEIRPYALVLLVATLCMLFFERWLTYRTWRSALFYGASVGLLLWIHYFLAFLVMAQVIYLLFSWRSPRLGGFWLRQGTAAAGLALLIWLPWLPVFVRQVAKLRAIETASGDSRGLGIGSTTEVTSLETITRLINLVTNGQPLLYGMVIGVGMVLLWRRAHYRLALAWGLGVPTISLTVNLLVSVYTPRYVTYLVIGLALVLGAGLAALPKRVRWAALILFALLSLWTLPTQLPTRRIPHRAIFQQVTASAKPGDVALFVNADIEDNLVGWQIRHYLDVPVVDTAQAESARRVWFVTGDWFGEDVQTAFKALEQNRPLQQVVGSCNREWCYLAQLLEAPPQTESTLFGEAFGFLGADVDHMSAEEIRARLWWRVEQPLGVDYSIGLQLLDANGGLAGQSDGPINHYNTEIFQTSALEPGRLYIDHRTVLPVISPLPPGEYQLVLVVYQWWDQARLRLPDGSDTLVLETITIP